MTTKKKGPGALSHSSAKTLLGCEQKYVNYKVKALDHDSDYQKSPALAIGSAFHHILEMSKGEKPKGIREMIEHCFTDEDIMLPKKYGYLVHGMIIKYLRLHKRMGFKVLAVEFDINTKEVTGKVDAIMEDPSGKWWIIDYKTAKTLYLPSVPSLPADPQLNLYAAHAEDIAKMFDLDFASFGGCRHRVVTKPDLKKKVTETNNEYTLRIAKSVKVHDIEIPIELMNPQETLDRHVKLYARSKQLYRKDVTPQKNYGNCMSFFRPCEYFSRCHGREFSEIQVTIETEA